MARSAEYLRSTNVMAPAMAEALKQRPFFTKPDDFFAEREARAEHLRNLRHLMPVPGPIPDIVTEKEIFVEARDGHKIRVIHYAPTQKLLQPCPLIVLYHEGGWSMGDLSDEEFNARLFVRDLGAVCLNVEYRLAPEHLFPTWIEDSWDVLKWASKNAASLGADATKGLIVGGSSAGGNISAILAHLSRNEGWNPPVTGQWLSVPFCVPPEHVPEQYAAEYLSVSENKEDPVLYGGVNGTSQGGLAKLTQVDLTSPLMSVVAKGNYPPTSESEKGKTKMAKAFFQVGGMDPLRDTGLVYERILREEFGSETKVDIYPGYGHMFWTNWPELEMSNRFKEDLLAGFRWLLS